MYQIKKPMPCASSAAVQYGSLTIRSLFLIFLISFMTNLIHQNVYAGSDPIVSKNSNKWYYKKLGPRHVTVFADKFTQTVYLFQDSKNPPCLDNCPYKYPFWDGTIDSVNTVLTYLNLPNVNNLILTKDKHKRVYTDPSYPIGEILIYKGKYFDCLWKVIIRER